MARMLTPFSIPHQMAAAAGQPAPDLQLADFGVRDTQATHVYLHVFSNQGTSTLVSQGDPAADPAKISDCPSDSNKH